MIHVMLDLETWGTDVGCDLRSIGAVVFDPIGGAIWDAGAFYIAVTGGESYGLNRDPNTVQWWSEQSEAARGAFTDPVELPLGLMRFSNWYGSFGEPKDVTLWANGPHFDEVILKAAYRACGSNHPWHYRAPRDFRTIMEAAGWPEVASNGTAHNALDDAIYQAQCVIEAYRIIRG